MPEIVTRISAAYSNHLNAVLQQMCCWCSSVTSDTLLNSEPYWKWIRNCCLSCNSYWALRSFRSGMRHRHSYRLIHTGHAPFLMHLHVSIEIDHCSQNKDWVNIFQKIYNVYCDLPSLTIKFEKLLRCTTENAMKSKLPEITKNKHSRCSSFKLVDIFKYHQVNVIVFKGCQFVILTLLLAFAD